MRDGVEVAGNRGQVRESLGASDAIELRVFGRTKLRIDDRDIALRPKERSVLAALAAVHPRHASTSEIATLVWGDQLPKTWKKSVHNHIARLRKISSEVVATDTAGYALGSAVTVNHERHGAVGGRDFDDLADTPEIEIARNAAASRRESVEDRHLVELVADGVKIGNVDDLRSAVAAVPLSEGRRCLLIRALAQVGQRREALLACSDAVREFAEAGVAASDAIRDLERRVLDNDPALRARLDTTGPAGVSTSGAGHLVGIDEHLLEAQRFFTSSTTKASDTIMLTGPAGIGKSTLAAEMGEVARKAGWDVYWTGCSPEPQVPLEPFSDLLEQLAQRHGEAMAAVPGIELLHALVPSLGSTGGRPSPGADRAALTQAIAGALRCGKRATLVIFEDVHWASLFTALALAGCQQTSVDSPRLAILCTSRTRQAVPFDVPPREVHVAPLSLDSVRSYLCHFVPDVGWAEQAAQWIHSQSGGNALHVRELTLEVVNQADGPHFRPPNTVPESLLSSLHQKLAHLTRRSRAVVDAASVLGATFDLQDLKLMLGNVDADLAEAVALDVVEANDDGSYRFHHELMHRATRQSLSAASLVELNDLAVRSLTDVGGGERLNQLARHAYAAASLDSHRAEQFLCAAADGQAQGYEFEDAVLNLLAARSVVEDRDGRTVRWAELSVLIGRWMLAAGSEGAPLYLTEAASVADDLGAQEVHAQAIQELCRLGPTSQVGAVDADAAAAVERGLDVITDPGPRSMVAAAGAMIYSFSGEPARARLHFDNALTLADEAEDEDRFALNAPLAVIALNGPADMAQRQALDVRLETIAQRTGDPETLWGALHLRMGNQIQVGDPGLHRTLNRLEELADQLHRQARYWELVIWRASAALIRGDLNEAETHANESLTFTGVLAESRMVSVYSGMLLAIRLAQGRAAELLDAILALSQEQPLMGAWHAAAACAASEANDVEMARRELEMAVSDDCATLREDSTLSVALAACGDAAASIKHVAAGKIIEAQLEPWAGRWSWYGATTMGPLDLTRARLAALLDQPDRAAQLAGGALAQAKHLGAPVHIAAVEAFLGGSS